MTERSEFERANKAVWIAKELISLDSRELLARIAYTKPGQIRDILAKYYVRACKDELKVAILRADEGK